MTYCTNPLWLILPSRLAGKSPDLHYVPHQHISGFYHFKFQPNIKFLIFWYLISDIWIFDFCYLIISVLISEYFNSDILIFDIKLKIIKLTQEWEYVFFLLLFDFLSGGFNLKSFKVKYPYLKLGSETPTKKFWCLEV